MISAQVLLVPKSDHKTEYVAAIDEAKVAIVGVHILNDAARSFKFFYLLDRNIERLRSSLWCL
jgi:hypothetical protein